jgi:transcriptional regulator with XRE-family HTH domain
MSEWFEMLAESRNRLGISQADLAARSHVSLPSVKSYELGKRHPSRPYLVAILDVLKLDRSERNRILTAAGYATDGMAFRPNNPDLVFTAEETVVEIERYRWPAFVVDEMMGIVAANEAAQRLWGVDLGREFMDPVERNLLSVASAPRFVARCANIAEALRVIVSVWKGHHRGAEQLENPSPMFGAILARFLEGDPKVVAQFLDAWQTVPPRTPKLRWDYPIVWKDPRAGMMRFHAFASAASEPDGLSFNDWIPVGSESWAALERLLASPTSN